MSADVKEYRVQGLTCGHCAGKMEQEIKKLPGGEDARLSYNSGILSVHSTVSMPEVEKILKEEGASLDMSGESGESGHETPSTADGGRHRRMFAIVAFSAALYAAALLWSDELAPWAGLTLYLIPMALSGYVTFMKGLRNIFKWKFTMDTLMTVALIGAVAIGEWKEATLVAILFGLNEWLEGQGMEKARRSMEALLQVAPKEAVRLVKGQEVVVPIETLRAGDIVVIKPGTKIPSDGTIIEGRSSVNEAAITGESMPVDKEEGSSVYGGSVNNEGLLHIEIDKAYKDSSLARILHLVREAQETKTPTELFINRFAQYYTPVIMVISALVTVLPPLLLQQEWQTWLYQGLAVLIVGCPCALILASPIAIVSGISRNARGGILVKGGVYLEQLGKLDTLAFDKTGTLTKGEPHVAQLEIYDEERFLTAAGAMEHGSSHPLAKAIMKEVLSRGTAVKKTDSLQTVTGKGLEALIDGQRYWLGNESCIAHLAVPAHVQSRIDEMKADGLTIVIGADEHKVLGLFGIQDEIREESAAVMSALHALGIKRTVMLTGDHPRTAEKVAAAVGVSAFEGGLLPEDKVRRVKELTADGQVGMVGDGINDAPALASAQLGIAMGKGTDSAIETADIVLMQDHLGKLPSAIRTARSVNRIIRFNIFVALGLKIFALLLTIPGWLTLWIAILSDMGATVFVTLVSLTLLLPRKEEDLAAARANSPIPSTSK
ncbi:cation-translocating P-type ATPase [Paenibacillus sp. J5C_2022]|uniref:heavy metal translocating P-type ATPase n=1 Tax=Paenibacillus sp. J5C2022 TaxID=2977129 RepID=UPI0021D3BBC2|nr:cation-translocating P-type ATPase [Paenibacillus sp. J5C2022]MCU6711723.1 cation-translocating P-type ATPase [Paenibacillus sp. J5C2022]